MGALIRTVNESRTLLAIASAIAGAGFSAGLFAQGTVRRTEYEMLVTKLDVVATAVNGIKAIVCQDRPHDSLCVVGK